jgi:chorismate synthase
MNTIGRTFRVTTWGESHGPAIGCVIDGCPAGLEITKTDIATELNKDIPDSRLGTSRKELNEFQILSGVYNNRTLGTPICIAIYNKDQRKSDYKGIKCYRPGHAEYGYQKRFGTFDPSGGGRASGRECIARLCAGAFARKLLSGLQIQFESKIEQLAGLPYCEDTIEKAVQIGESGDSTGGIISLKIKNVPAGVGSPIFEKLNSMIIYAISTIGGIKGIECGSGFKAADSLGSENNDPFGKVDGAIVPLSNHSGGTLGGISTGQDLTFRFAVKPTPSIKLAQRSVNYNTCNEEIMSSTGRFDKNFTPRVAPIAESMAAIIIVDQLILTGILHPTQFAWSDAVKKHTHVELENYNPIRFAYSDSVKKHAHTQAELEDYQPIQIAWGDSN